jgi:hypothetical protein
MVRPNHVAAEDNQSGADFLRNLGVSEAYIAHFWGFLSHAILNVPVEDYVSIENVLLASFGVAHCLFLFWDDGFTVLQNVASFCTATYGKSDAIFNAVSAVPGVFLDIQFCQEVSATALVRFFRRLVGRSSMEMGFAGCGLGELLTPGKALLEKLGSEVRTNCEVKGFLGWAARWALRLGCTGMG